MILDGWPDDRGYELRLPRAHDASRPVPLVIAVHGYTHDSRAMRALTSPDGDPGHPESLDSLADREGFAVAYPNGSPLKSMPGRGWNAGGGKNGFAAVSNPSVQMGVEDVRYFRELLADIESRLAVDARRIYLVGISNGGAMVNRLAMEMPERIAAVASVAGGNQFSVAEGRAPGQPLPVLFIHGARDTVWPYHGGSVPVVGKMAPIEGSVAEWAACNGCNVVRTRNLPGGVVHQIRPGPTSRGDVEHYRLDAGGHSWPGGQQFLPKSVIGAVSQALKANEVIWGFFQSHPRD